MKKNILTLALISFAAVGHAQWFIGGNVGYNHTSEEKQTNPFNKEKTTLSEFSFAPTFGYQINRFAVGGSIGFVESTTISKHWWRPNSSVPWGTSSEHKTKTPLFGIQPFVRYTFAEWGKFSVFANVGVHFLTGKTEKPHTYYYYTGPRFGYSSLIVIDPLWPYPPYYYTVMERYKMNSFGINLVPVLSYNLSERISLEATLNFMNFGWNRTRLTHIDEWRDEKITERGFGIGVNSGNVVDVGAISIGFIYKFRESGSARVLYDLNTPSKEEIRRQQREERRAERRREQQITVPSMERQDRPVTLPFR